MVKGILSTLLFFAVFTARAQWQRLPGPTPVFGGIAGNVTCIATNDTFVWTGTEKSGVFRVDAQTIQAWVPKNNGLKSFTIFSLFSANGLLVATTQQGVYKSTDNGDNWSAINTGLPINKTITAFAAETGVLLASTADLGVFRSVDNGQTWQTANNGMLDNNVLDLESSAGIFWALTLNAGLFKSADGGQSWTGVNVPGNCNRCQQMEIVDNTILIADSVIRVSRDGGDNWDTDNSLHDITGITAHNGLLSAHSQYRLYNSIDTGRTWQQDWEFNTDTAKIINTALYTPGEVRYIATKNHGLYRGSIAAITWKPYNTGLLTADIQQLKWNNNKLYAIAFGLLHYSLDRGINWQHIAGGSQYTVTSLLAQNNQLLITTDSGIYKADDTFFNWQPANSGLNSLNATKAVQVRNNVFAFTKSGMHRSPDFGNTWVKYIDNIDTADFTDMEFDGNDLYVGTTIGFYKSDGVGFTLVDSTFIPKRHVFFVRKINGKLWLKIGIDTHVSEDGGTSWPRHYYLGIGYPTFANSLTLNGKYLYASTNAGYMFRDTATEAWHFLRGIDGLPVNTFERGDSFLYAGSGAGIWRMPLTDVVESVGENSAGDILMYPNPASEQLFIGGGELLNTITLYDFSGREVASCNNCNTLDITHLESGLYLIKAKGEKGVYAGKIVIE
ncbi:MAG TPA: T9SS type A sorting domain-containing protein [Bacteroidia bacterium]|nr:T9SS type A sorting domain-containing protein [Bacteroidia bacterium]